MNWEAVIGLEIHVQLNTRSKLFSPAPNHFGDEPNVNISEICTGQPGSLPVLNEEAVKKAVQFGLAVGSTISKISTFDRKSYFYPDSPRNFQITQFEHPIIKGGSISTEVEGKTMTFEISHAHLEDDAGMLKHFSQFAGVDYNRAGVPLIEIVSMPCMHSPKEASSYAKAIKAIFQYLDASDCNMEEGSIRFDANVSVRHKGEKKLRDKVEIKNMNSFAFLELAIESEIKRQIDLYTHNKDIEPGTYRWDQERKKTILMRKKEMAADYRYFPEPDLVPVVLADETIQKIKRELPELPQARLEKYLKVYGLSTDLSGVLILEKPLSDYFEEAYKLCKNARNLANWIVVEFTGRLKEGGQNLLSLGIPPSHVAKLVNMIDEGKITGRIAKSVADDMVKNPGIDPAQIVEKNPDYKPLEDQSLVQSIVAEVLKQNPESIADYKAGKTKAFAFLVGQVMKLTRGKADPALVNDLLHKSLDSNQ